MLIATLPTAVSEASFRLCETIFAHPAIAAARYNTGGDSPLPAKEILGRIKQIADRDGKILYVDLEGRQSRVASWTPQSRGCVTLNRRFTIELPGKIHFRKAGWCEIVNAEPGSSKLYFTAKKMPDEYFLGAGQSVHILARKFSVTGYLNGRDYEFTKAAAELGIGNFMLSFIEAFDDVTEFEELFATFNPQMKPRTVLKIESKPGIELVRRLPRHQANYQLMAARDDLFLSLTGEEGNATMTLKLIAQKDPEAIVASRLLTGLEHGDKPTLTDISDAVLMHGLGYKHFMFADELSGRIGLATAAWKNIILPSL